MQHPLLKALDGKSIGATNRLRHSTDLNPNEHKHSTLSRYTHNYSAPPSTLLDLMDALILVWEHDMSWFHLWFHFLDFYCDFESRFH